MDSGHVMVAITRPLTIDRGEYEEITLQRGDVIEIPISIYHMYRRHGLTGNENDVPVFRLWDQTVIPNRVLKRSRAIH